MSTSVRRSANYAGHQANYTISVALGYAGGQQLERISTAARSARTSN
ncbi:hypothetical protein AB0H00_19475 [Nocardia sp. NPDC023852]